VKKKKLAKKVTRKPRAKKPPAPRITFVGGKWYNEHGKEVPKPKPKAQGPEPFIVPEPARIPVQAAVPTGPLLRYDEKRIDGCFCARPSLTGHVPGCKYYREAMYACEGADRQTLEALAGEQPLADFQRRRLDHTTTPGLHGQWDAAAEMQRRRRVCMTDLIQQDTPRRRCWLCPFWERHKEITPFDSQKVPADAKKESLDMFPAALDEEDDDLPF
jgi:hypothetical protein